MWGLIWALLCWVTLRYLLSPDPLSLVAARDFVPYMYAAVALLAAGSAARASTADRARTAKFIWRALLAHAALVAVVLFVPSVASAMPFVDGVQILSTRDDFDGLILGVLAGLSFIRWGRGDGRRYLLLTAAAAIMMLGLSSRAGLLATVGILTLAVLTMWREGSARSRRRLTVVPVILVGILVLLPSTVAGARLLATFGYTAPEQSMRLTEATAQGTTDARERSWGVLTQWILAEENRMSVGVGFGPDFLYESHAAYYLLGPVVADERSVRSPHNYYLGSWARLGLIGLVLIVVVTLSALRASWRERHDRDDLTTFAALALTGFVIVAAFGVMLESPFGAVPFFWSLGILAPTGSRAPIADKRLRSGTTTPEPGSLPPTARPYGADTHRNQSDLGALRPS